MRMETDMVETASCWWCRELRVPNEDDSASPPFSSIAIKPNSQTAHKQLGAEDSSVYLRTTVQALPSCWAPQPVPVLWAQKSCQSASRDRRTTGQGCRPLHLASLVLGTRTQATCLPCRSPCASHSFIRFRKRASGNCGAAVGTRETSFLRPG
uniref:Uncharacterized protein n=1 Tax=Molossus molossus TaxID=27622 RepID=A0A7J8HIJ7_MOLMO|nr:hypothetical protein HJG59_011085 [Molossus molossus]